MKCFQCHTEITLEDNGIRISKEPNEMYQCSDCHYSEFGVYPIPALLLFKKEIELMEHLDLFTPVEQSEPHCYHIGDYDGKKSDQILFTDGNKIYSGECYKGIIDGNKFLDFYESTGGYEIKNVTHWLDLSKLTTKEKCEYIARESYQKGWNACEFSIGYNPSEDVKDIIQNSGL